MSVKKENDNPNMLKPEEYSVEQMLSLARAFLTAAKRCNEPSYKQIGWTHPLLVPIVTNISFACELFLKTLLKIHNTLVKAHDLSILFESLPQENQIVIIGLDNYDDFKFKLKRNSCLFLEWRYLYERHLSSINIDFLFDFAERMSCYADQIVTS